MKINPEIVACNSNNLIAMYPTVSPREIILEALKLIFNSPKDEIYFEPTISDEHGIFHVTYYNPNDKEYLEPQYCDVELTRLARIDVVCRENDQDYFPYHEIRKFLIDKKLYFGQYLFYNDGQPVNY